ncbi:MAG: hypothetical protein HYY06_30915 [Deltaproteobacteria bacterium]|nr:hypothetical protein [Deltaproteobacteria bacterium]
MGAFDLTVGAAVERIRERNRRIRAFVWTRLDEAIEDARRRAGQRPASPLHGVPYGLKDNWDTAGIPTTGGSHRFRDRVPEKSSPVHEVFEKAGAVLLGKTNLSDLGLTPEAASWVGGVTANPHDLSRTSGGSSGGAAAAVADGMAAFDWGNDIGGSIRLPAAYCGVLGMRLSSETWPLRGLFSGPPPSVAWMCGQGPIARTVPQMREVIRVAAPALRTGPSRPFQPRGVVVWSPDPESAGKWRAFRSEVTPALEAAFGETRHDHGLPDFRRARNVAIGIWGSHFEDFRGSDPMSPLEGVTAVLSALFLRGLVDRRLHPHAAQIMAMVAIGRLLFRDRRAARAKADRLRDQFAALWDHGYLVVAPVSTYPAPRHGRSFLNWSVTACTMPGNVADATAIAVPFGRFPDGLPRALQVMGPPGSEEHVLDAASRILGPRR